MEPNEVTNLLQPISQGIDNIQKSAAETKAAQEKIQADFEATQKAFQEWQATKNDRDAKNEKALDELIKKANSVYMGGGEDLSFAAQLKTALADNHEKIKQVRKGVSVDFQVKA